MADTAAVAKSTRRRRNWREYEGNRPSSKYVAKRVSAEDHDVLTRFAKDHGTDVAKLLTPFLDDLIQQARAYCGELGDIDDVSEAARAS
ncbi:hypothetical protein OK015_28730 (plasmid) [Mycobacterium sp. Aquia_216]|uniref:hypothetical protein n=1 Tax=Mycobacterium sp. Aquia_216 TaxID=2991729 RepID=UPI00227BD1C1|nr:hypothetical protein [Mycobacterium sp. Aquia_216]WAJ48035.1 hypothetical protein OK015_28730 [Mycobacterium sp. Aquia_216]